MPLTQPPRDCPLCPRLVAFRHEAQRLHPDWHNNPVPYWGDEAAALIVIGLAPGMKGANRTGRPFTGDYAGDLLYATLKKVGLATGEYRQTPSDGLELHNTLIANAVACVPPENKPTPAEQKTCRQFLTRRLGEQKPLAYLALGRIAHDSLLTALGEKKSANPFAHGAEHALSGGARLFDSYHCSRYNTNTGVLTTEMFEDVVGRAAAYISRPALSLPS
ncbi:MAG: uracil-DNA glycosylase [Devosia sp.]|uniref:uracil-DNA glycosylase n=1 Tax=Devosia sp. 66-22 TaxID=1895753 RepID=UPI00092CC815|nr:uracil-DNA glycosylase [Devosia sp. 66-22]MBN9345768.1 uracil-DNA glycosylase [Devosia sp.]OJX51637.1 MAG: uracil-DNA glycosylase [Devosia sp. 66-22]